MKRDEVVWIHVLDDHYHIKNADGEIIDTWLDTANQDSPEDLIIHRDIGTLICTIFRAGYALGIKDSKGGLIENEGDAKWKT